MRGSIKSGLAAAMAVSALMAPLAAEAMPTTADILIVIDESLSMQNQINWIPGMVTSLDNELTNVGITGNQFGVVGFVENTGAHGPGSAGPHAHTFNMGNLWGTAADVNGNMDTALTDDGSIYEDGYDAIQFGFDTYSFRSNAAVNVILITDEDRDNRDANDTYASILSALQGESALLNVVVNCRFKDASGGAALGVDTNGESYSADGSGGFTSAAGGTQSGSCAGTTKTDYVDLAWASGGAAWDLNFLDNGGNDADSFTAAFVDLKVEEIMDQDVPEAATLGLFGLGLAGLGIAARRRMR